MIGYKRILKRIEVTFSKMYCNIYIVLAIFGLCQEVIFCVPCNCGLGKGDDVCTPEDDYPLVVRPHTLPKVDIAAISSHHHHHGAKSVYEKIEIGGGPHESNIAPLKPVGDLCTCGKAIVKPANVPEPACSGCRGEHSSSHHHHSSGSSHHHHHNTYHIHESGKGPIIPGDLHHHRDEIRLHDGPLHLHGSGPHHHEGPGGPFYPHGSGPHSNSGPGSVHDHHHHHSTRYDEDHNKVHKIGFGHKGSHVHHDDIDINGHRRDHGPYVRDGIADFPRGAGPSDLAYYQVGGHGPHAHAPDLGPLIHSDRVGDFKIDYPICGLPVMHHPKVPVYTSQVPADVVSKALARNQLRNKQAAVEHLQFGTRTAPREEPSNVEPQKDVFAEESYYKLNGETLELAKLHQEAPVEEVEVEEEEPEPEPQQVVIQPISYHSIGFVPTRVKPHKFITPLVTPVQEVIPASCGVDAPPHCRDGYKSGNVIIKNVPASSDASEPTCDEVEGNVEYSYSQSSSSSSSSTADSHSAHYRRTGCATCGL